MKQIYRVLSLFLIVAVASSCRRNVDALDISQAEARLIGEWTMSKVENKVRGDGKWGRNDVSANFRDWQFGFATDYTLTLYIPDEDKTYLGIWEFYETWESDNDGDNELVTELYLYIYDPDNLETYREMIWQDMKISSSNFRAREKVVTQGTTITYIYEMER